MAAFINIFKSIIFGVAIFPLGTRGQAPISLLNNRQIDSLLCASPQKELSIPARMKHFSEMFLKMPYSWTATGEGPDALYEPYPLVNFDSTNCMVYCEHVLAMAISDSWDNFFNNLQHIRYQNGIIGMRTRNHYTLGDWLPENSWLLANVSKQIAGKNIRSSTRTISHRQFFTNKGITDLRYVKKDYTSTIDYIPKEFADTIKENLKDGDLGILIFAGKKNIFAAHMVMFFQINGKWIVREASSKAGKVIEHPYSEWSQQIMENQHRAGFCVLQLNEVLNTPGRIILPWKIAKMKDKISR